jgi:hypothetical protein
VEPAERSIRAGRSVRRAWNRQGREVRTGSAAAQDLNEAAAAGNAASHAGHGAHLTDGFAATTPTRPGGSRRVMGSSSPTRHRWSPPTGPAPTRRAPAALTHIILLHRDRHHPAMRMRLTNVAPYLMPTWTPTTAGRGEDLPADLPTTSPRHGSSPTARDNQTAHATDQRYPALAASCTARCRGSVGQVHVVYFHLLRPDAAWRRAIGSKPTPPRAGSPSVLQPAPVVLRQSWRPGEFELVPDDWAPCPRRGLRDRGSHCGAWLSPGRRYGEAR